MAKKLTSWRKQGQSAPTVDFDDSTVDYDSGTTPYAGSGQSAESVIKKRTIWSKPLKRAVQFIKNPASDANEQIYDNTSAYDVALTYDSIVVGESRSTSKKGTIWSKA